MNATLPETHPSIEFYDSDYPGRETTSIPSNFDQTTEAQGLAYDVERFRELARETGGPILELCCGTGRVAIPLARDGHQVVAVDVSAAMLDRLRHKLQGESSDVAARVEPIQQDITRLDLEGRRFPLAILAFNSLLCLTDAASQRAALTATAAHLSAGGILAIDAVNPLVLPVAGDPAAKPFFTRTSEISGRVYTRFAAIGPLEPTQRQRLYGWYDEILENGTVRRTPYEMHWRPMFRSELELMLELASLRVVAIEGGHRHEPFTSTSAKMFALARKDS